MGLSPDRPHHRPVRRHGHHRRGAGERRHRRNGVLQRGGHPHLGGSRLHRRPHHPAVRLSRHLYQRLLELPVRPARGDRHHRRLQLHRHRRRCVYVHRHHLRGVRRIQRGLHPVQPAHQGDPVLRRGRRGGVLRHGIRPGPGAADEIHRHLPAAAERGGAAHLLHGPEGRGGPGEDVRHGQRQSVSDRGHRRHRGGVRDQLPPDAAEFRPDQARGQHPAGDRLR